MDAGYLLSEGGKAFCAARKRSLVTCDYAQVVEELQRFCSEQHDLPVLRLYWYDGAADAVPTDDHLLVASRPRVKLRLGRMSGGKQKGVDSLIVHDLITLAHERAVCSMYLLGGDEDLREGVAAAQRVGVQVILLGVDTGERNQAPTLINEADEHLFLPADLLRPHFRLAGVAVTVPVGETVQVEQESGQTIGEEIVPSADPEVAAAGETFAQDWASRATPADIAELLLHRPRIPTSLDAQLLLAAEERLGRSLRGDQPARYALRESFWRGAEAAAEQFR